MQDAINRAAALADVGGDRRTDLVGLASNGLIDGADPAFGEHLLDIAQTRRETETEPLHQSDRVGRKLVPPKEYGVHSRLYATKGRERRQVRFA